MSCRGPWGGEEEEEKWLRMWCWGPWGGEEEEEEEEEM